MSRAPEVKQALREWVALKSGKVRSEDLDDETPILEQRIITSLQVMDLILHIEKLTRKAIDVENLSMGSFRNVNAIYQNFFQEDTL